MRLSTIANGNVFHVDNSEGAGDTLIATGIYEEVGDDVAITGTAPVMGPTNKEPQSAKAPPTPTADSAPVATSAVAPRKRRKQ